MVAESVGVFPIGLLLLKCSSPQVFNGGIIKSKEGMTIALEKVFEGLESCLKNVFDQFNSNFSGLIGDDVFCIGGSGFSC